MHNDNAAGSKAVERVHVNSEDPQSERSAISELTPASRPDNLEALYRYAHEQLRDGHLTQARAAYHEILNRDQGNLKGLAALARVEKRLGDNESACELLRAATRIDRGDIQLLADLAAVLRELDRNDEATSVYQQILERRADDVQSHLGLGWIARARGDRQSAMEHFSAANESIKKAGNGEANHLPTLMQQATVLRGMNWPEQAEPIYHKILAIDPTHVQSHVALGWIALGAGKYERARGHFKTAAELAPTDPQVQLSFGRFLMQRSQVEEAEAVLRGVAERLPHHSQVHAALGALARKKGDWHAALAEFRAATEIDPKNVLVRIELGRAFCDLMLWGEAEQNYRRVLADSPGNIEALIGLANIAKAQGDLDTALGLFEEASIAAPLDLRAKNEIRKLTARPGAYDWQTEVKEALAITRVPEASVETQIDAAKILVEYGLTEAARPLLSRLEATRPAARQLLLAVRQIERMGLDRPVAGADSAIDPAEAQLESLQGFLEVPAPGSDTILIVFGGTNNRLWMTFSLLHRILRKTGVSVVYCRDLQRLWYAGGIVGLGHDLQSSVEGFRALIDRRRAKRVLTLGNCIGCLGALRFGLLLGAQGVLAISPKLRLLEVLEPLDRVRLRSNFDRRPAEKKNIHQEYLESGAHPPVGIIFGEDCAGDAYNANTMADLGGVTVAPIPQSNETDSVKDLLIRGLFEPLLQDFVAQGVVSQRIQTLISASRNPN